MRDSSGSAAVGGAATDSPTPRPFTPARLWRGRGARGHAQKKYLYLQMKYIFIFSLLSFHFFACSSGEGWQQGGENDYTYEYKLLPSRYKTPAPSSPIDWGDELRMEYKIFQRDSLLEQSDTNGGLVLIVPARQFRNAWESAMMRARLGDSLLVRLRMRHVAASMQRFAQIGLEDTIEAHFTIVAHTPRARLQNLADSALAKTLGFRSVEAMKSEQALVLAQSDTIANFMQGWAERYMLSGGNLAHLQRDSAFPNWAYQILPPNFGGGYYAQAGDTVCVYYALMLEQGGEMLDNGLARGERLCFALHEAGHILPAFHHAAARLPVSGRGIFFVPPALGYGAAGSPPAVPPASNLLLYMQLADIRKKNL